MSLYLKIFSIAICASGLILSGCQKKVDSTKEVPQEVKGTIVDNSSLDGCGFMIRLDDGTMLETSLQEKFKVNEMKVILSYTLPKEPMVSACMAGKIVNIQSMVEDVAPNNP